jgi:beta-glucosidase
MYDVFSLPDYRFPPGFVWGSATAGHQIEGDNIHSNWWAWEQTAPWVKKPSGKACNSWQLFEQDVDLLSSLGHRMFRMSLEWSRIEPEEGVIDETAIRRYVTVLERLKRKDIKVCATLHHFTHPNWFEKKGAFGKRENLRYFERHVERIAAATAPYVDLWTLINEYNGGLLGSGEAKVNTTIAHARAYHIVKGHSKAPASSAHAFIHFVPLRLWDKADNALANFADVMTNEFFFHAIRTGEIVVPFQDVVIDPDVKGSADFWAVNSYTRHMVDARIAAPINGRRFDWKRLRMIDQDFYLEEMYPEGLLANLERLTDLPVYITENGCSCDDDDFRIVYLALHLSAIHEAIARGVDVRGYLYWSLLDNYEWGSFVPRFGLVGVDFETFERTPKKSALLYREIIEQNGLTQASLRKHLRALPTLARR